MYMQQPFWPPYLFGKKKKKKNPGVNPLLDKGNCGGQTLANFLDLVQFSGLERESS